MRSVFVRCACLLTALAGASALAGEVDQRDAQTPSAPVIPGGVTPRIIIEEEEQGLLGVPDESAAKAEDQGQAKAEQHATFVVTCKLVRPNQDSGWREPGLVVATVPADESTKIPVRLKIENLPGGGAAETDELRLEVPGTGGAESIPQGHQIHVKVSQVKRGRVRFDATVEFQNVARKGDHEFRAAGHSGRFVGELAIGKPAQVVLETDDLGQPKHWVEFVVRAAGEEIDEADAASRAYPVVYSVAGLVRVDSRLKPGKRPELDFAPLIKKIEAKVSPDSWASAGGEGKIQSFARNASLVVTQTAAVHEQLAAYLQQLLDDEDAIQTALERQ